MIPTADPGETLNATTFRSIIENANPGGAVANQIMLAVVLAFEAGLLFVTVPVRNTTRRQMTVEYRATFFDRNRVPIQETTWFPRTMTPHTQQTFTVNSTSPRADDFQIDIREAKGFLPGHMGRAGLCRPCSHHPDHPRL